MPYATREQIAHVLKITPRMVNRHVKDHGMPIVARGEYDLVSCVHWYLDYLKTEIQRARRGDESEQQARARLVKATANLRELDLAREEKRLLPVDAVKELWERIVIAFKNKMLSLPTKLPQKLIGMEDPGNMKSLIEGEIYEALGELSRFEVVEEPETPYAGDSEPRRAPAETHRKRVGGPGTGSEPRGKRRARKVAHGKG